MRAIGLTISRPYKLKEKKETRTLDLLWSIKWMNFILLVLKPFLNEMDKFKYWIDFDIDKKYYEQKACEENIYNYDHLVLGSSHSDNKNKLSSKV